MRLPRHVLKFALLGLTAGLLGIAATGANASLIGDSVTVLYNSPDSPVMSGTGTVAAGTGDEFQVDNFVPSCPWLIDFEASSVLIRMPSDTAFSPSFTEDASLIISDLDWIGTPSALTAVNVIQNTIYGLDSSAITFSGNSVTIDLYFTSWLPGRVLELAFVFEPGDNDPVVPEPATLALMGMGMAGAAFVRRRRHVRS